MENIAAATDDDLVAILDWLTKERDETGHSFIVNETTIRDYFTKGELYVIRRGGTAVAFQAGRFSPQIAVVRPDLRGQGLGKALAEWTMEDAAASDVCILDIECSPGSAAFWRAMGFAIEKEGAEFLDLISSKAHRVIGRRLTLPDGEPVDVLVEFHEESAKYNGGEPLVSIKPSAVRSPDGRVHFSERIIARGNAARREDIHLTVTVDGVQLASDRAKYLGERGVHRDLESGAFYIDSFMPKSGGDR